MAAAAAVAAVMMFGGTAAVFADEVKSANVEVTMQQNYEFMICHKTISVTSDMSDKYGLTDSCSGVSALDVMLAMHKDYYGDSFTKDAMNNYFVVKDSGFSGYSICRIFGTGSNVSALACGYYINDASAFSTDDEVADGAKFDMFIYQDAAGYSDAYATFKDDYTGEVGSEIKVQLDKDTFGPNWNIEKEPMNGADIFAVENGKLAEKPLAQTDANGEAVVSFDKEGVYYLTAVCKESFIVMPWCKVTVTGAEQIPSDPSDDGLLDGITDPSDDSSEEPSGSVDADDPAADSGTEAESALDADSADTGDSSHVLILIMIAGAAAVCGGVTVLSRRRMQ